MNRHLIHRLCPSILQNVTGRVPAAQITAPDRETRILSMTSEADRLAQFDLSKRVHDRKTCPVKWRYRVTS